MPHRTEPPSMTLLQDCGPRGQRSGVTHRCDRDMEAGWGLGRRALPHPALLCGAALNMPHILSKFSIEKGSGSTHRAKVENTLI